MKIESASRLAESAQAVPSSGGPDAGSIAASGAATPFYRRVVKRGADVALTVLATPVWVPVILLLALVVALDGRNPFYSQARLGRGGRVYRMWKLRSMVPDAEAVLEELLASDPAARAEWSHHQKLKNDPRITRIGRILRAFSLDELPQLWNVLTGDMSLVGPRPMLPDQAPLYPGRSYFTLRPGITGPWQVSTRNESSFAARARYDDDYDRALCFGTDLGLLLATIRVVFRGTGY